MESGFQRVRQVVSMTSRERQENQPFGVTELVWPQRSSGEKEHQRLYHLLARILLEEEGDRSVLSEQPTVQTFPANGE